MNPALYQLSYAASSKNRILAGESLFWQLRPIGRKNGKKGAWQFFRASLGARVSSPACALGEGSAAL